MSELTKLTTTQVPAGTLIHIQGMPFYTTSTTVVDGSVENAAISGVGNPEANLYTDLEVEMLRSILEDGNPSDYLVALNAIQIRLSIQRDYFNLTPNNP